MTDKEYARRVHEAMGIAIERIRRSWRMGTADVKDIAQAAVIKESDSLREDGWQQRVSSSAFFLMVEEVRRIKKECAMRDRIVEVLRRRYASWEKRDAVKNIAIGAVDSEEWNVIHRLFWHRMSQVEVGIAMGVSQQTVSRIKSRALDFTKQAFHKLGITRANWRDWYYEA